MRLKRGFSLVELMVSIFIVSCCILILIGIFTIIFSSTQKGNDITSNTAAAEMMLEEYLYKNESSIKALGNTGTTATFKKDMNGTSFWCRINVSPPSSGSYLREVSASVYSIDLSNITSGQNYNNRTGYGKTYVKMSKFVFLSDDD